MNFLWSPLSDPTETPPLSRDRCSNTLVALRFLWYTPTFGLLQSKDRPNKGGITENLASEAYRAIGGVARNSIANRAIVGH